MGEAAPQAAGGLYDGRKDSEVLEMARAALERASAYPARSARRQVQWQIFDSAMAELTRRAMAHALRKINEQFDTGR
jgi:hypothetical protein